MPSDATSYGAVGAPDFPGLFRTPVAGMDNTVTDVVRWFGPQSPNSSKTKCQFPQSGLAKSVQSLPRRPLPRSCAANTRGASHTVRPAPQPRPSVRTKPPSADCQGPYMRHPSHPTPYMRLTRMLTDLPNASIREASEGSVSRWGSVIFRRSTPLTGAQSSRHRWSV